MPLTTFGSGRPIACRMVGATSITWLNCVRIPFFAWMPFGHDMTMPLRVPPKSDGTCFIQPNGASNPTAQPDAMCGYVSGPPHWSSFGSICATVSCTPLKYVYSLNMPFAPPSPLVPLSPAM